MNAPVTADPEFNLSGIKPDPYFAPADGSPLINAGAIVPSITDGFSGSAPEIGAYEVQTIGGDYAAEAEDLPVTASSDTNVNNGGIYSGGEYSYLTNCSIGDYIEYTINLTAPGTYQIRVGASAQSSRGKWQLAIDGTNQGSVYDAYSSTKKVVDVNLGNKTLSAGVHKLRFKITGKNAASPSYKIGFDYFDLNKMPTAPTVIATEGFESNSWTGGSGWSDADWTRTGACWVNTAKYSGTYGAHIRSAGGSLTRGVNLANTTQVQIKAAIRCYHFEPGDSATLQFYDGASWIDLETFTSDTSYLPYTYDLSSVPMNPNGAQKLRLQSGLSDNSDFVYIDAIEISGVR